MKTLDDIIPPSRRSEQIPQAMPPQSPPPRTYIRKRFPWGTLFVVLVIIIVSIGALMYFTSAEVSVTPLTRSASVTDLSLTGTARSTDLPFEIVTVQKVASQTVASNGTRTVTASAQGQITVYNTQTKSQSLIATTRFQTPSGLIFRSPKAIVIPAAKGTTPGQLTITIVADKPGSEYNVGPTTFVIPGFSGQPQYTQVTGKSTTAMSGGASGNEPTVAADAESTTRTALRNSLATDLAAELRSRVPQGYVILAGASETSYAPMPTTPAPNAGMAELKEQGTMRGIAFPAAALAKMIAKNALKDEYGGEPVTLGGTDALTFKTAALPATGTDTVTFTLSGSTTLVSVVEPMRIAAAVAGKPRSEAESVLRQYPEVKEAVITLRPFWQSTFPEDPTEIKVTVRPADAN